MKENAVKQLSALCTEWGKLKSKPENKPLYQLNLLDVVRAKEPHTSVFLASILSYSENGHYIVLESFIEKFLSLAGLGKSAVINPKITAEVSHVDVRILDNDYAIIIENKLMNAPFQRNQLGRYIESTHARLRYDYDRIFLVILPQYWNTDYVSSIRASAWRCPPDGLTSSNDDRACACLDRYQCRCDTGNCLCDGCKDFRPSFRDRTVVVHTRLSEWLHEVEASVESKQTILRSAISQFADFTKGLYNLRLNDNMFMDLQRLISDTMLPDEVTASTKWGILNEKAQELAELKTAVDAMKLQLSKDLIDEWYHELKPEYGLLQREVQKSFGLNIDGVWIGCWSGFNNDGAPYWGFYCENGANDDQRDMVNKILVECDIKSNHSSPVFISWENTTNGAHVCRRFYIAAKKLGYL